MDSVATERANCAVHVVESTGTCARCGNFVCEQCLEPGDDEPRCEVCRQRVGLPSVPFESVDIPLLLRWPRMVWAMARHPTRTLSEARVGSPVAALSYSLLANFVSSVGFGVAWDAPFRATPAIDEILLTGAAGSLTRVVVTIACGLLFHLAVRALGGTGGLTATFWAVFYLDTTAFVYPPAALASRIHSSLGNLAMFVGLIAAAIYWGMNLSELARRQGVSDERVPLAGWTPFLFALVLVLVSVGVGLSRIQ